MQSYFFSSQHHPYMRQISQRIALIGHGFELDDPENLLILTRALLEEEGTCAFIGKVQEDSDEYQEPADAEQGYA